MLISDYFTPVPDASVTFNGADVYFDRNHLPKQIAAQTSRTNLNERMELTGKNRGLHDLTFKAKKGEVILVLGNHTSSLFKAMFHASKKLHYSPTNAVRFKNNEFKAFSQKCPQEIIYNNEEDMHYPFLTVQETIDFALSCKFNIPLNDRIELRNALLSEFGLSHVLNTIVGNDYVRGVSGGERKRISIIETFIANGSVYLWDNSTKGLDSSTALDFVNILDSLGKATSSVNFVKISQASDKIIEKFDKILLLSDSYQVFYGTLDECLHYFREELGILKQTNDSIIEYLTSILNFKYEAKDPKSNDTPKTELDFYNSWIKTPYYSRCKREASEDDSAITTTVAAEDVTPKFSVSSLTQLYSCSYRAFFRSLGDRGYLISQFCSIVVQGFVIGSLFYDLPQTTVGSYSRGSLTFFSLLFFTFLALADMPGTFQRRTVVMKHMKLHFYHPSVETFASTIYDFFFKFVLVFIFTIILYFLAHLQYNAARFFIFLLFLSLANFSMISLFSLTALISPTLAIANGLAGILLLGIAVYASYVVYLTDMHHWFKWISYVNPIMYCMEAILSNELFNMKLDCTESIIPRGPSYDNVSFSHKACAWQGATLGNNYVRGQDYLSGALQYKYSHVWRNFGIVIGFLCFYLFCALVVSEYITPLYTRENLQEWSAKYLGRFKKNQAIYNKDIHEEASQPNTVTPSSSSSQSIVKTNVFETTKISDSMMEDSTREDSDTILNAQKHVISWKNIEYTVGNNKKLINDVSGYISSGLTALMGESGAGKTTLLNVLSQRTQTGIVSGELLIDGQPLTDIESFRRSIGFVQQQDVHLNLLTVRESLEISCVLRGDGDMEYLTTILKLLRLSGSKLVADLTVTEKKLLSIGVELVTKPSLLLFLDEPTSGLDSEAALLIVQFLKQLSLRGQAILCTIHQPSRSMISYFDNIFLLKMGGECVYFGPTDEACNYFMSHDNSLTYDREFGNPADFVIDVVGKTQHNGDNKSSGTSWHELWNSSPEKVRMFEGLDVMEEEARASGVDFTASARARPSYLQQLKVILKREYTCTKRDKAYVYAKFGLNAGAGLFIGFSFWKTKTNVIGLQYGIFLAFMTVCVSAPLINQLQAKVVQSKDVYTTREASSNTFHWSVLLLSQTIVELPLAVLSSSLFFVCCYFCCGFDNSAHIAGVYYLNYIVFSAYYMTFGLWLIHSTSSLETSAVLVAFFYSFTVSFCGVMQPLGLMNVFWKQTMYRLSPYTYFIETFVSLLLHDRPVNCETMELVPGQPTLGQTCWEFMEPFIQEYGGHLHNNDSTNVCGYCMYSTGDDMLKNESMSYGNRWRNFGIQICYVVFNILAMFGGFYMLYVGKWWSSLSTRWSGKLISKNEKTSDVTEKDTSALQE
ncbi:hypothetical protein KAFR_0K01230 [Kazachstania africana CBS 2517]|uniref:ABC transporter domain-containing protein n=1 Tax=Kazachstania africana (strain ATCC 22294 / BCRC 22015 / CBS 2517 / CECT 1963 / NBRC 1671 / NRRL Y-8276) TaxID=1071382 RepID=H2B1H8_KAZAF|nr:hypothetical protein KAFR_0K01230 [Kazachstania africana CBS 2517]CCF60478.1 hypothetical protein KAFR_0K01230 [Kazachstania africana CBS 2517]